MRVSMMIRGGMLGLTLVALAACVDSPVMPNQARTSGFAPSASFTRGGRDGRGPRRTDPRRYADHGTPLDSTTFTLTSQAGIYRFGTNALFVASGALCDISSPYGSAYFNDASSCVQPAAPIQVTVYWGLRHGQPYVEFSPELRFNPADDAPKAVLALSDKVETQNNAFQILWRNEAGVWVNEALTDPSLKAFELGPDMIARRIKHFSGYNVSASYSDLTTMY